ncbi:hypothetical protein Godav_020090 [Gossypium davidsonii]|uniref:Uncharacterized protein n=1 Tax=Gossypium davidsonii TaxID=34287 RepID=A0A7J8R1V7_GOSDV|nr:hypothetical protein [Gossypium davidsonii]
MMMRSDGIECIDYASASPAQPKVRTFVRGREKTSPIEVEDNVNSSRDDLEQKIEQMDIKCYRVKEEKIKMIEELNLTSDVSTDYKSD